MVDAATIVVGTPTVLAGAHPQAVYAAYLVNALRPKTRFLSIIGSFGWGGRAIEQLSSIVTNLKVEIIEPVMVKGLPRSDEYIFLDRLADSIYDKHKAAGLIS